MTTTQKKVVVVAVVDDLVENRSFEEYVWCIAFKTLFPKARAFVCGINDEKFESFPKRRQENESHIDRSIDRTGGRRRKGSSINCTIDDVRTTNNVCWYVRLVLFRVHFYLGCATTDLYSTKRYR